MPRVIRIFLVGVLYLCFAVFGLILNFIVMPLTLWRIRDPEARIAAGQDLLHRWSRFFFARMRGFGIGRAHWPACPDVLARGEAAVVIANHPSLLDVVFLSGALPRLTYVAKESWIRGPLGWMLRACGHIGVPKGKTPIDGALALRTMMDALAAGRALLVFPEGTRSPMHELHRFERGAFEAALRVRVPIVCCLLRVEPSVLRKDQPWYDVSERCVDFEMMTLSTLPPGEFPRSGRELAAAVELQYRQALGIGARADEANLPRQAAQ